MQKAFYYIFGAITCITGVMGIYYILNPSEATSTATIGALLGECIVSFILCIMLEPRPRETEAQKKHDDDVKAKGVTTLLLILAAVSIIVIASSCTTTSRTCTYSSRLSSSSGW